MIRAYLSSAVLVVPAVPTVPLHSKIVINNEEDRENDPDNREYKRDCLSER